MPLAALRAASLAPRLLSPLSHGFVYQIPALLDASRSQQLFERLVSGDCGEWRTEVDAFGPQQRQSAYFGDDGAIFSYVGLRLQPRAWPAAMGAARQRAAIVADAHNSAFTACLANHYGEGNGSIPFHHDEVRAHGDAKLVLVLSLGGERRMLLRRRGDSLQPPLSLRLPAGSALVMGGSAQDHWEHSVPLDPADAPRRVSLTFRTIELGFEEGRPPPLVNT